MNQPGFLAIPFGQQPSLRVRGALMGGVTPLFSTKFYPGIARVVINGPGRVTVFGSEAL